MHVRSSSQQGRNEVSSRYVVIHSCHAVPMYTGGLTVPGGPYTLGHCPAIHHIFWSSPLGWIDGPHGRARSLTERPHFTRSNNSRRQTRLHYRDRVSVLDGVLYIVSMGAGSPPTAVVGNAAAQAKHFACTDTASQGSLCVCCLTSTR